MNRPNPRRVRRGHVAPRRSPARLAGAKKIPGAELLVLEDADHFAAHVTADAVLIGAALQTLRRGAQKQRH